MSVSGDYFSVHYAGLLGHGNWILVESGGWKGEDFPANIPKRITVRKSDGRILISGAGSPVEISYCAFSALVAENLIAPAGDEGDRRHIYRPTAG
jgi:hypothetical protein